jgi:cell division protein FtsB
VRKRIKLFYVVVIAFVIVAGGLMTMNRLDQEISVLEDTARETRLRQLALETENGNMKQEIAVKDTESYIRKMARKNNRFLMPGETRFVVVNPEALYAPGEMPGQEIELETETAEETDTEAEPVQEDTEG